MSGLDSTVLEDLGTIIVGTSCEYHDVLVSTNDLVKERADTGAREGLVVVSGSQTKGRGRQNRSFSSPPGGLYLSILLRPDIGPDAVSALPLIMGLAVSKAISTSAGIESELKWPNDVNIKGKKVCGILVESSVKGDRVEHVIIGIGINANTTPSDLPNGIRGTATTIRTEAGREISLVDLLRDLVCFLDMHYTKFISGGTEDLLDQWSERSTTLGKEVRIVSSGVTFSGKALGIDQTGALMIETQGELRRVDFGDCQHLE
jgi:BirA family biotin operon repressor/biotin-[acetyl-CoA-carboxylase] ligase